MTNPSGMLKKCHNLKNNYSILQNVNIKLKQMSKL